MRRPQTQTFTRQLFPPYRQGPEISLVFKDNLCDVMGLICYLIFSPDTHYNRSIIGNAQIKGL